MLLLEFAHKNICTLKFTILSKQVSLHLCCSTTGKVARDQQGGKAGWNGITASPIGPQHFRESLHQVYTKLQIIPTEIK